MPVDPRSEDEIETSLQTKLSGKISKLTNFVSTSFNQTFLDAFAEEIRQFEIKLLAVQFSGWVDYAGGPISENDLQNLDLEFTDDEAVEQYVRDEDLNQLGKIVGVTRDPGSFATGQVTVQTASDQTQIPEGMKVSTPPGVDNEYDVYRVDADSDGEINEDSTVTVTPSAGSTEVTVDVIAEERGNEYNTGAGTVTFLPSPPPGVEGVTNQTAIDGGEDEQDNEAFREDIKNAVFESSGGGTTAGIRGYIENNVTGVNDVIIDEFINATPVYVDVIVDGGSRQDVLNAIETSRPAGIEHNLVRPSTQNIGIDIELQGTDIDNQNVVDQVEEYLFEIELGDDMVRDKLIQSIMNADDDIENILALNVRVTNVVEEKEKYQSGTSTYSLNVQELGHVENERHYFDSNTNVYRLNAFPVVASSVSISATVNGSTTTLSEGTDFDVIDNDGDGELDSVDFSVGGDQPDADTIWTVDYDLLRSVTGETKTYVSGTNVYALNHYPVSEQGAAITDASGNTYELGTDFDLVDTDSDGVIDSVDFSIGGSSPNDGEDFFVDYELQTGTIDAVRADVNGTRVDLLEDTADVQGDYDEADSDASGYADTLDFGVGGQNPDDGTQFQYDYYANRIVDEDLSVSDRQKVVPDSSEIVVTTYS